MFSWQNTEHLNSPNSERVCHAEITNLGHSQLRGAVREGAVSNCSMSGSGKSSFAHFVFFLKVGPVQKVSKHNRLPLPGFVNECITDWVLTPRASPSLHSCAECAHRQRSFASLASMCFVAGSRKACILHTTSPCSLIRVEIQKEPSASSTLRYFSELGSATDRIETWREWQNFFIQCGQINLHLGKINRITRRQKIIQYQMILLDTYFQPTHQTVNAAILGETQVQI